MPKKSNSRSASKPDPQPEQQHWLDLDGVAEVEVTSEDWENTIECALVEGLGDCWRAAEPGEQTISLRFIQPVNIDRISLKFSENHKARIQEFVLRSSSNAGKTFTEVVRQQFTFSPKEAVEETENYRVALKKVTVLELIITPDIKGSSAVATLDCLRVSGSV